MRWGIVGPGGIAGQFARAVAEMPEGQVVAVSSRSIVRARAFAEQHGIARAYEGVEDFVADDGIDAVYVATPHSRHEADVLAAVGAGKHVLCEKAFALDAVQAERMVAAARGAGVFLMEAMWARFLPAYRTLRSLLDEGAIGEPLMVEADFGFRAPVDPHHRLFDLGQGGGALLDLGIYPVQLCAFVLGLPERVVADGVVGETGVDETMAALLHHAGGRLGVAKASLRTPLSCTARISGTAGWIDLPAFMHCPATLTLHRMSGVETIDASFAGEGLRFEIEEVQRCVAEGATESSIMPLDETVALMRVLDTIREHLGVVFAGGRGRP